ncbi:MAG: sporulation protein [Paenibacillus sp. RIFOXYA1_FULL_44_5]|nr:MAG: sporulation protein [Paenibacillus sp. RIFOXYA1_FULL_44_5]
MGAFIVQFILRFFVAFGVVFGASMMSGVASILTLQPPASNMKSIADSIKIWAMVAAIGGTIDPIRMIEQNIQENQLSPVIKQLLLILGAFSGAQMGTGIIYWICGGGDRK